MRPRDAAERRQVTVMFSDLVGSDRTLCADADPRTAGTISAYEVRRKPCSGSAGSWRSSWATACWSISAIRRPMRTMLSALYAQDWS